MGGLDAATLRGGELCKLCQLLSVPMSKLPFFKIILKDRFIYLFI